MLWLTTLLIDLWLIRVIYVLCLCVRNGCVRGDLSLLFWFRDCVVICEITGFEVVLWLLVCFSVFSLVVLQVDCAAAPLCSCCAGLFIEKRLGHQGCEPWPPRVKNV